MKYMGFFQLFILMNNRKVNLTVAQKCLQRLEGRRMGGKSTQKESMQGLQQAVMKMVNVLHFVAKIQVHVVTCGKKLCIYIVYEIHILFPVVHPPEHQIEESASSDFDKMDSVDTGMQSVSICNAMCVCSEFSHAKQCVNIVSFHLQSCV